MVKAALGATKAARVQLPVFPGLQGLDAFNAAFREVIRIAAVRDLVALGEAGAFDFLLEPGAEERMWG